ncbi:MAG: metallophosphatase [Microbacterium sp. 71-36]|uniref:metallophosphoesterase n=1 Tax=unclassified Microbacterium TaxID=2609290 RepID=UPI000868BD92|nr:MULTISPECIES: metallophosphoesterase [unclassified Microbacterium]MBN9212621.1 metallophosphoesterase [Microbacterium sp.]ODT38049.1 MAG: metallophosphatase [Microbacterium sp. SCN 71-17]ODU49691.1 MAG: metallophosphatase [Microbacterium sp. SCN 70-10]OJV77698.1 MAG: metallophosphatase [Microbacterium sp. 71-36]
MTHPVVKAALAPLGVAGAAAVGAAVWGMGVERYLFTVRYHALRVLPKGSDAVRILHVSDAHMAPWQHRKQEWMARLVELAPDLVVNTGDNLGHRDGLTGIRTAFAPLRGVPGLVVHGSNDFQEPSPRNPLRYFTGPSSNVPDYKHLDVDALDRFFSDDLGWSILDDTAVSVDVKGLRVTAFGVNDAHRNWDRPELIPPVLSSLDAADLTLGVMHAPYRRTLDRFIDLGADVLLAGHTHGGQVRVPFSRKALVSNCDLPLEQARGLSEWTHAGRTVPLNVSAGLGHSIYAPVRFACRPEATLLTLLPR